MGVCATTLGLGAVTGCTPGRAIRHVPPPVSPQEIVPPWPPAEAYPAPDLADAQVNRQVTGLRPYRRGSVRIDTQIVRGKTVIHNYGHGGAGITLAPATSLDALDLLEPAGVKPPQAVAVLGAGVVGLTTADLLLDRGYGVVLYTDRTTPDTTSDVAGGQFAPAAVAVDRTDRLRRWMKSAADYYLHRATQSCGVHRIINFTDGSAGGALRRLPSARFRHNSLERLPIAGVHQPGEAYETLLITPPIYLPWLTNNLRRRGARLRFRRFESPDQVASLPEKAVINCMGLGSKMIFEDDLLTAIRGRLVMLKQQSLGYLLSHRMGYLFSRPDALVLGGTYDVGKTDTSPDPHETAKLLERHRRFFRKHQQSGGMRRSRTYTKASFHPTLACEAREHFRLWSRMYSQCLK